MYFVVTDGMGVRETRTVRFVKTISCLCYHASPLADVNPVPGTGPSLGWQVICRRVGRTSTDVQPVALVPVSGWWWSVVIKWLMWLIGTRYNDRRQQTHYVVQATVIVRRLQLHVRAVIVQTTCNHRTCVSPGKIPFDAHCCHMEWVQP